MMRRSLVFILHFGFWFCYALLIAIVILTIFRKNPDDPRILYFVKGLISFTLIPSIFSFYAFYAIIFPRYLYKKQKLKAVGSSLITVLLSATIGSIFIWSIGGAPWDIGNEHKSFAGQVAAISFFSIVTGVVAISIKGFVTWFDEITLKEELRQKTQDLELALIKSQLDPHFLFNTINNIDTLITKSPETASEYLNKLSEVLRFVLYETKSPKIALSKEIKYIEKYIDLHKIRTSNSSYVTFGVRGNPERHFIAAMTFIPFIENAFKHTPSKKIENAIVIGIQIVEKKVVFTCENHFGSKTSDDDSGGLGNDLIQRRLKLLYPASHELIIDKHNGIYKVSLTLTES